MSDRESRAFVSDEELTELFWQRDERAIKETGYKYGKLVYSISWGILHNESDSEECQNDTYLGVWNAIPPTRPNIFRAFICKIARRIAINRYNEKAAKSRVPSEYTACLDELAEALSSAETVESEYEQKRLGELLNGFLAKLTRRERYIFIGRFYMAESLAAIGEVLDVNASTVYRELERLKKGLREYLVKNGVDL